MRVDLKAKLVISNDNSSTPTDIVFNSGDQAKVDTSTFNEADSKLIDLPPATVEQQVNMDNIASAAVVMMYTSSDGIEVILVPTGKVKADCSALKLSAGYPLLIGSDIAAIYLSNTSIASSAKVRVGVAGN